MFNTKGSCITITRHTWTSRTESQGKDGSTALARSVADATGGLKPA